MAQISFPLTRIYLENSLESFGRHYQHILTPNGHHPCATSFSDLRHVTEAKGILWLLFMLHKYFAFCSRFPRKGIILSLTLIAKGFALTGLVV